jgi:pyruvate formate lyase activating enzyme
MPLSPGDGAAVSGGGPGRLSRRNLLRYGAAGLACTAGGGGLWWYFASRIRAATAAEIFPGDAPQGRLWQLWQERGWVREARHYLKLGQNLQCKLCPNECLLGPEDRGRCRNRVHKDGKLYTLAYGNPSMPQPDPVEKKPLFHFLPGSTAFSFATTGCGFRCLNCQNWNISQRKPEELKDPRGSPVLLRPHELHLADADDVNRMSIFPDDMVAMAQYFNCRSIAYTYSEPTVWFEYMLDTAKAARAKNVKNIWVTCGYIQQEPLAELCQYIDAAHVDLKGFSDETYSKLNSGKLGPVLATLGRLRREQVWFEVINLMVPTYTDDLKTVRRMCRWLVDNLGPDCPLHFSRFMPAHKLTQLPLTPREVLLDAQAVAREEGLHYAYVGNCREAAEGETTFCPHCHKAIIERAVYSIETMNVADGKCKFCQGRIAGVWA